MGTQGKTTYSGRGRRKNDFFGLKSIYLIWKPIQKYLRKSKIKSWGRIKFHYTGTQTHPLSKKYSSYWIRHLLHLWIRLHRRELRASTFHFTISMHALSISTPSIISNLFVNRLFTHGPLFWKKFKAFFGGICQLLTVCAFLGKEE